MKKKPYPPPKSDEVTITAISLPAFSRLIAGALKCAIDAHGPITAQFIGSATKRVVHAFLAAK